MANKESKQADEELDEELADKSEEEEDDAPSAEEGENEDDDEDEDEDEGDDEDDEEEAAAAPPVKRAPAPAVAAAPVEDPNWWVPHLVLGVLVLGGVLGFFGAFTSTLGPLLKRTRPAASASATPSAAPSAAPTAAAPKPGGEDKPAPARLPAPSNPNDPIFAAKHVLVSFTGARNAKSDRPKEEAKKRADAALAKLKSGTKFEDVVAEFSDEPGAKATGGNLGRFKKDAYDPTIVGTVTKLEVGKVSEVFESPFGYEIVMRTE